MGSCALGLYRGIGSWLLATQKVAVTNGTLPRLATEQRSFILNLIHPAGCRVEGGEVPQRPESCPCSLGQLGFRLLVP